jgi:hypothetical protein
VFAGSNISMEDGRLAGQSAAKRRKLKPTANRGEGKKTKPRSGEIMQPTAQAVG